MAQVKNFEDIEIGDLFFDPFSEATYKKVDEEHAVVAEGPKMGMREDFEPDDTVQPS